MEYTEISLKNSAINLFHSAHCRSIHCNLTQKRFMNNLSSRIFIIGNKCFIFFLGMTTCSCKFNVVDQLSASHSIKKKCKLLVLQSLKHPCHKCMVNKTKTFAKKRLLLCPLTYWMKEKCTNISFFFYSVFNYYETY